MAVHSIEGNCAATGVLRVLCVRLVSGECEQDVREAKFVGPTASKAHAVQVLGLKMACQKAQSSTPLGTELAGATGNNLCESPWIVEPRPPATTKP